MLENSELATMEKELPYQRELWSDWLRGLNINEEPKLLGRLGVLLQRSSCSGAPMLPSSPAKLVDF